MDARLAKEARDRAAESNLLKTNLQEEVMTRKSLSQSFQALERCARHLHPYIHNASII